MLIFKLGHKIHQCQCTIMASAAETTWQPSIAGQPLLTHVTLMHIGSQATRTFLVGTEGLELLVNAQTIGI